MEQQKQCPSCHVSVRSTDYYCFNCGKNLKPTPLSTSVQNQITLYIKTLLLPPLGIVWGFRYLRENNPKAKIVGTMVIVLTIIEIIYLAVAFNKFTKTLNEQINSQMSGYGL